NQNMGFTATNDLLFAVGKQLTALEQSYPRAHAGRLNGSDFALLVAGDQQIDTLAQALSQALAQLPGQTAAIPALPVSLACYGPEDSRPALLAALDRALATAESRADGRPELVDKTVPALFTSREAMHAALTYALETGALRLHHHPVLTADKTPLHEECPSQLYFAGEWRSAAVFI